MHSEVVLMLPLAYKDAAAYPPSNELQLNFFHQPKWQIGSASLFNRLLTVPLGAHMQ